MDALTTERPVSRAAGAHWDELPRWMGLGTVLGNIAMWAVRQSPYHWPDGLQDVLAAFGTALQDAAVADKFNMLQVTPAALEALLDRYLVPLPEVQAWNEPRKGNHTMVFVDRSGGPAPDYDFIDLSALTRNIVRSVFLEMDADAAFDEAFEAGWAAEQGDVARMHVLERTSPMGGDFFGTCQLCGMENLPSRAALEPCENPLKVPADQALLDAIEGPDR